jgi:hypothetical protein
MQRNDLTGNQHVPCSPVRPGLPQGEADHNDPPIARPAPPRIALLPSRRHGIEVGFIFPDPSQENGEPARHRDARALRPAAASILIESSTPWRRLCVKNSAAIQVGCLSKQSYFRPARASPADGLQVFTSFPFSRSCERSTALLRQRRAPVAAHPVRVPAWPGPSTSLPKCKRRTAWKCVLQPLCGPEAPEAR